MILDKYQVESEASEFALYVLKESGGETEIMPKMSTLYTAEDLCCKRRTNRTVLLGLLQ